MSQAMKNPQAFSTKILSTALIVSASVLCGCSSSPDGPETVVTTGKVTWQGQPLESGRVVFRLLDGDRRGFSAPIENGRFEIETYPGQVRVEIRASRIVPGQFDTSNGDPVPKGEMYIPAKYNSQSSLVLSLPESDRPTFELDG